MSRQKPAARPVDGVAGVYLNLDRSRDRRRKMERQLAALGLSGSYHRFPATDGQSLPPALYRLPGEVGCFISHMRAVELAATTSMPLHIIEDDTTLTSHVAPFLQSLTRSTAFDHFDIIFLDMWVDFSVDSLKTYQQVYDKSGAGGPAGFDPAGLQLLDLRNIRIGAASSYVVSPARAATVARFLREEARAGVHEPVDSFYGMLARTGRIRAGVAVPFLTAVDIEAGAASLIQNHLTPDRLRLYLLARRSFFVDRDMEGDILPGLRRLAEANSTPVFGDVAQAIEMSHRGAFD